ncbi:MAG: LytR family transcriptional regulator [Actinobacteria bacterium]|nr:LytR family transcriptional regulator [Actinomycetota bacterium]
MNRYRRPGLHRAVLAVNGIVAALLVLLGAVFLWTGFRLGDRKVVRLERDQSVQSDVEIAASDGWNLTEGDLSAKNFLVTGSDNGGCVDPDSPYAGAFADREGLGERSDTIMIIRVNPRDKQAAFLSFPRDLWVKIGGSTRQNRINTAFDRTDPNRLIDTIYQNFGIEVDHYVNIDFCAFKKIVDAVGGVRIPFLYETRDRKTGLYVPGPACFTFTGDHALAYVRSRSGYSYLDPDTGTWERDGTGDFGRIARQQDFIRRALQRALDKGASNPVVANELLNAGLSSVITDDQLSPTMALQLAQAMRDLKAGSIPSFMIEGTPEQIGDQSVLIPRIQNETMRQVLALFQGAASFAEPIAEPAEGGGGAGAAVAPSSGATTTSTVPPTTVPVTTTTAVPIVSPKQLTLGVAPPNDPTCH